MSEVKNIQYEVKKYIAGFWGMEYEIREISYDGFGKNKKEISDNHMTMISKEGLKRLKQSIEDFLKVNKLEG